MNNLDGNACSPQSFIDSMNCSGHGTCLNCVCACDPGWTGKGDFVSGDLGCFFNEIAIRILNGMYAACAVLVGIPYALVYLKRVFAREGFRGYGLFGLAVLSMNGCLAVAGVYRTVYPDAALTANVVTTCSICIGVFFFWVSSNISNYLVTVRLVLNETVRNGIISAVSSRTILNRFRAFFLLDTIVLLVACFVPILPLIITNTPAVVYACGATFLILMGVNIIVNSYAIPKGYKSSIQAIDEVLKRSQADENQIRTLRQIKAGMEMTSKSVYMGYILGIFAIIGGAVPAFQTAIPTYVFPVAFTTAVLTQVFALAITLPTFKGQNSASLSHPSSSNGPAPLPLRRVNSAARTNRPLPSENVFLKQLSLAPLSSLYFASTLDDQPQVRKSDKQPFLSGDGGSSYNELTTSSHEDSRVAALEVPSASQNSLGEFLQMKVRHDTLASCLMPAWKPTLSILTQLHIRFMLIGAIILVQVGDSLALSGIVPTSLAIATGCIQLAISTVLITCCLSWNVLKMVLMREIAVWSRIFFTFLGLGFFASVLGDLRIWSSCIGAGSFLILGIFADSFTAELSGARFTGAFVGVTQMLTFLRLVVMLQFDVVQPRSNVPIQIIPNTAVVWATFQAARDFLLAAMLLCFKDWVQRVIQQDDLFVHIQAGVAVKIVGLRTEHALGKLGHSKRLRVMQQMTERRASINASGDVQTPGQSRVLVLRERDSIAVRWFGFDESHLHFMGNPFFRSILLLGAGGAWITFVAAVLTGLLPSQVAFVLLLVPPYVVRSMCLKSVTLLKTLTMRISFLQELVFAVTVLVLFGVLLNDARAIIVPVLFFQWTDFRLGDARCVFYHSEYRDKKYGMSRGTRWFLLALAFMNAASLLALPGVLVFQVVPNVNFNLAVNLRTGDTTSSFQNNVFNNEPNATIPVGALAQVRAFQFVADFIFAFAVSASLDFVVDALRQTKSLVRLKDIKQPVKRIPVSADADEYLRKPSEDRPPHGGPVFSVYESVHFAVELNGVRPPENVINSQNATNLTLVEDLSQAQEM